MMDWKGMDGEPTAIEDWAIDQATWGNCHWSCCCWGRVASDWRGPWKRWLRCVECRSSTNTCREIIRSIQLPLFSLYSFLFFFRFEQGKMKRVTYKKRSSFWWRNTSAAIDCMLFCSKCLHFRVDWHQRNPLGRWGGGVHLIQYLHYFQKGVAAEREAADIRYAVVG